MASTYEMIQFIRARLDEAERIARAAAQEGEARDGRWDDDEDEVSDSSGWRIAVCFTPARTAHVALHDPAHVLADIKAKRTVLDAWEDMDHDVPDYVIDALAEPYADHPDFRAARGW